VSAPDSSSIYREAASPVPLRVWPIRTHVWSRVGKTLAILVAVGGAMLVLAFTAGHFRWTVPFFALVATLPGLLWLMLHDAGGASDLVAGGRGEIRLFEDRVEVPRAALNDRRYVDVFPLADLSVSVSETRVSLNLVMTTTFQVAELRAGALRRRVSSRLFESEAAFAAFLADLQHVRHRLPVKPDGDDYDERLDRELDALD
jgi:hypothetical protein